MEITESMKEFDFEYTTYQNNLTGWKKCLRHLIGSKCHRYAMLKFNTYHMENGKEEFRYSSDVRVNLMSWNSKKGKFMMIPKCSQEACEYLNKTNNEYKTSLTHVESITWNTDENFCKMVFKRFVK